MIKGTVTNFRKKQAYFSIETNGSKIYYYLPKKLQDIFINSLAEGETVSFNISDNTKIYNRTKMHQIISFISISYPYSPKLIYDSKNLQRSVFNLLINTKYFLIVDFEVSMARYKEKNYKGEIIQVGYMLVDHNGN
jgi:cold shock CspA family protein